MNCVEDDPVATGTSATLAAIQQAGGVANAILTLAFMGPEEKLLEGVAKAAPNVPVVGGSASDASGRFLQFGYGHVETNAVAVGAVGGEIGYAFAHGYQLDRKQSRDHTRAGPQDHRTRSHGLLWMCTPSGRRSRRPL